MKTQYHNAEMLGRDYYRQGKGIKDCPWNDDRQKYFNMGFYAQSRAERRNLNRRAMRYKE